MLPKNVRSTFYSTTRFPLKLLSISVFNVPLVAIHG